VFAPYGVGDGTTTFGIPNRAYLAVGRDNASGSAANVLQVSTTISLTSGSATATVASATGLFLGMNVSHPKLPFGTVISAISGTTLTLSATATGTVAASAVRFSPLKDAQTLGATGGAQSKFLTRANLPNVAPIFAGTAGTVNVTSTRSDIDIGIAVTGAGPGSGANVSGQGAVTSAGTFTPVGTIQDINGAVQKMAFGTIPPTIVMNFIIKR
jgi:hypothetical protein